MSNSNSPTPPSNPSPRSSNRQLPSPTPTTSTLQAFLHDAIEAANPGLQHLASHSTLGSLPSGTALDVRSSRNPRPGYIRPLGLSTFDDQRHAGKPGLPITRNTREWDPGSSHARPSASASSYSDARARQSSYSTARSGESSQSYYSGEDKDAESVEEVRPEGEKEKEAEEANKAETGGEGEGGEENESETENEEPIYPGPWALTFLLIGLCLSIFLISLDRTIITTAIPFITRDFNSPEDIGWYGSAYLLTASAFQPLYGRIFMLFNIKWSYLVSLGTFLAGSLLCGIAPNSITLIIGRSIAGLGSAGILTGSFVVISHAMPLKKRPVWTAVVGMMFGLGATVGPLLGGVFTDLVTWRWCFYFNLPIGGATLASMVFFFRPPKKHALMGKSFFYRITELDLIGNAILLGASIMLFLALQFTEQQVAWDSAEIIGLLVGAGITFIIFCVWQWWKADGALIPPRIIKQRSVAASCMTGFFIYACILIQTYFLPYWFQAVKAYSAVQSGIAMIPYVAASAVCSLLAGVFVSKNGYFTAPAILGCAIGTVGCGFISTITPSTPSARWIGYEILTSAGIGFAIQQGFSAIQIVLPLDEVAIGTAAVVAFQSLGGAVFVSVGNTILQNSLLSASRHNQLPGVDIQAVIKAGATEFRKKVPPEAIPALVAIYVKALQKVFLAAIPMAGLAFVSCLFLEWKSVNEKRAEDEEAQRGKARVELEKRIMETHNRTTGSEGSPHVSSGIFRTNTESEVEVKSLPGGRDKHTPTVPQIPQFGPQN